MTGANFCSYLEFSEKLANRHASVTDYGERTHHVQILANSGDRLSHPGRRHHGVAGWIAWARTLATSTHIREGVVRIWHRLHTNHLSPRVVAVSVGIGLTVGLLPVYGLHGLLVLAICVPLRLDSVLAFAATMVSNPLTFPFLVVLELKLGEAMLGTSSLSIEQLMAGQGWSAAGKQLLAGTATLASGAGLLGAAVAWALVRHWQRRRVEPEIAPRENGA